MKKTILIAAVMFISLTAAAFAQSTWSVGSIPVTTVTSTGYTELAGAITFSLVSGTTLAGTFTIDYGVPVTVPLDTITVVGGTLNIDNSSNQDGRLVIDVAGAAAGPIIVNGVRVAVAGTGLSSLVAHVSATENAITAGQTTVTVINAIHDGLENLDSLPLEVNGVNGNFTIDGDVPEGAEALITVDEGFLGAFYAQNATTTTSVNVRFTLNQVPPPEVTITFPGTVTVDGVTWVTADEEGVEDGGPVAFTSDSDAPLVVYYRIAAEDGTPSPTAIDTLEIPVDVELSGDEEYPLPATKITVTASLSPISTALNEDNDPPDAEGLPIPRYMAKELGPVDLVNIVGSQTALLITYASLDESETATYNTGLAIANTTKDPGDALGGKNPAVPQKGKLTFYMYRQGSPVPAPIVYETKSDSPGQGLDAAGNLPSGSTYTVMLSELLDAAGAPASFQGYIIVITGFTNAHGEYFISDFNYFTHGALMSVIDGHRDVDAEGLNQ